MFKRIIPLLFLFFLCFGLVVSCNSAPKQVNNQSVADSKFLIWWPQGFLPEENEVIGRLVAKWEKENDKKADVALIPNDEVVKEVRKAVDKGKPPDVLFTFNGDTSLYPRLAWENQLLELSELINPMKDLYSPGALQAGYYENRTTKQRGYYAVPLGDQLVYIHCWQDLLKEAGFSLSDIPKSWNDFWEFWKKVHNSLREKGLSNIYGMGLSMSNSGVDSFFTFEHFLEGYNVKIVDQNGKLILDDPTTRRGIITALEQYTSLYKGGYVPPKATEWRDSGNNTSFLNRESVMTINPTISIPLTVKQDQDTYLNKIATIDWPQKSNGEPITLIRTLKQLVIFKSTPHQEVAKNFVSFILRPENLDLYLKELKGRFFPVMPKLQQNPVWHDTNDPHLAALLRQSQQPNRPSYQAFHPAYGEVLSQNVWAGAILGVLQENLSPEQAADRAIARIKQIFADWK